MALIPMYQYDGIERLLLLLFSCEPIFLARDISQVFAAPSPLEVGFQLAETDIEEDHSFVRFTPLQVGVILTLSIISAECGALIDKKFGPATKVSLLQLSHMLCTSCSFSPSSKHDFALKHGLFVHHERSSHQTGLLNISLGLTHPFE